MKQKVLLNIFHRCKKPSNINDIHIKKDLYVNKGSFQN